MCVFRRSRLQQRVSVKHMTMAAMVESVKNKGVTQSAIVRPREDAD